MSRQHHNPNDPNVQLLEIVAARLGKPMLDKLVFVGGSVAGLLITDPMQPAIRPTDDVDLIVQVTGRQGYYALEDDLRALGFVNDISHDLGDFIAVIDGRDTLLMEIEQSKAELRDYLAQRINELMASPNFINNLEAHFPPDIASQGRVPMVKNTLRAIAALH